MAGAGDPRAAPDEEGATRRALLRFLRSIQRPERPVDELDEEASLVESGLIDSLAVMQIVAYLEETHGIDFLEHGLDPQELRSVRSILDVIERLAS